MKEWFNQPSFKTLTKLDSLLLKSPKGEDFSDELKFVIKFYHDNFNESSLMTHLQLFSTTMQTTRDDCSLSHIINLLKSLSPIQRSLLSEVCTLVNLSLVTPATNAVSKRSASGLRVKSYLRSSMTTAAP